MKSVRPDQNSRFTQGIYKLLHPEKYLNQKEDIIYRSSYELIFCELCDTSPSIVKWQSEPFFVSYFDPVKNKHRRYYPDFIILMKLPNGNLEKIVLEVKPSNFITRPVKPVNPTCKSLNNYNFKLAVYVTNMAKYSAAKAYCEQRNMKYSFLTENFINRYKKN